jgi:hypothetical protein
MVVAVPLINIAAAGDGVVVEAPHIGIIRRVFDAARAGAGGQGSRNHPHNNGKKEKDP